MKSIKDYLSYKISRANKRVKLIKNSHGEDPSKTYNYFGGWSLGYWEGKLSAYENMLDEIESGEVMKYNE